MSAEETFFYNSPKIVIDTSHAELIHFLFSISHDILKILALLILTGCPDNFGQGTGQYSKFAWTPGIFGTFIRAFCGLKP